MFSLPNHPGAYALASIADPTLLILPRTFQQELIQGLPVGNLRHWHHVIPAKISPFSFHPALLVAFSGGAELRLKSPMRSESDESRRLFSLLSAQNFLYCTLEIVIPAKSAYTPEISKGPLVRLQKRLLTGVREAAMEGSSTGHAAHAEHISLLSVSADISRRLIPVHLRFYPPAVRLGDECLVLNEVQLNLPLANITTNRALRHPDFRKLLPNPRPDPVRCVALLSWRLLVALQNCFDEGFRRFYSWLAARVDLSLPRYRISQCFPYHAPVDPKLPGHSFARSHSVVVLPSNLFE